MDTKGHSPGERVRVLVWGGWFGSRNVGDTAILEAVNDLVRDTNSTSSRDCFVWVPSLDPEYTATRGVVGFPALRKKDLIRPLRWLRFLKLFRQMDLIVVSGGTPFLDGLHLTRIFYLVLGRLSRANLVLFGVGAKPIRSRFLTWLYALLLRQTVYCSARDSRSQELLATMRIDATVTLDSAFWYRDLMSRKFGRTYTWPADSKNSRDGVANSSGFSILCTPRILTTEAKRLYLETHYNSDEIHEIEDSIATFLRGVKCTSINFAPMHYHGHDSDIPLIERLAQRIRPIRTEGPDPTLPSIRMVLGKELDPESFCELAMEHSLVVSMRLHSTILALSMGLPVIAVSYEEKVNQIMTDLGLAEYLYDIRTELGRNKLVAAAEELTPDTVEKMKLRCREAVESRYPLLLSSVSALKV